MPKGYPTPDNPVGEVTFTCLQIIVPDVTAFKAAIYGLYGQMANDWFWMAEGTMTPSEAAFLAARGLGETQAYEGCSDMSCVDLADCIETDETVQAALETQTNNTLASGGYTPNPESSAVPQTPQLTPEQTANNLLTDITDCEEPAVNMAIARSIVRELHESVQDAFETIELSTNTSEAAGIVVGAIPVVGTGAKLIELANWMLDTVVETYDAAYNQSSEDEIACAIFCHMESECEISLDSLLAIYEDLGSITVPTIATIDDLIDFITTTTMGIDVTGVAIFHYFLLHALKFGGVVFEIAGFNDLAYVIKNAAEYQDFSYDGCDDCPQEETPTLYWRLYFDFRLGQKNTVSVVWNGSGNDGSFVGNGWYYNPVANVSTLNVAFGYADFGAQYVIRAVANRSVRRGSDGNGSNDIATNMYYPNANFGGVSSSSGNSGIALNTNDVTVGVIQPLAAGLTRSMALRSRVQQNTSTPPAELRVYEWVIWGVAGVGDTKPQGASWAGNTLPATVPELFPS